MRPPPISVPAWAHREGVTAIAPKTPPRRERTAFLDRIGVLGFRIPEDPTQAPKDQQAMNRFHRLPGPSGRARPRPRTDLDGDHVLMVAIAGSAARQRTAVDGTLIAFHRYALDLVDVSGVSWANRANIAWAR